MCGLEEAIILATKSHLGQRQRNGEPYILHPLRVMMAVSDENEKIAAILHDVVEDSDITLDDLIPAGFSPEVIELVRLLTHENGKSYEAYIERLRPNPSARRIKIADLQDNMNVRRLPQMRQKDLDRLERYHKFWLLLRADEENEHRVR